MRTISAQGSYSIPKDYPNAGKDISFDFEYEVFDSIEEAINELDGKTKVLAMLNQTHKEDCRNNASGSAKSENGHSPKVTLTAEQKEARKQQAKADREILSQLKARGLSLDDIMKL
jgi:hypothetical protein